MGKSTKDEYIQQAGKDDIKEHKSFIGAVGCYTFHLTMRCSAERVIHVPLRKITIRNAGLVSFYTHYQRGYGLP